MFHRCVLRIEHLERFGRVGNLEDESVARHGDQQEVLVALARQGRRGASSPYSSCANCAAPATSKRGACCSMDIERF